MIQQYRKGVVVHDGRVMGYSQPQQSYPPANTQQTRYQVPQQRQDNVVDSQNNPVQKCAKFFKTLITLAHNNQSGERVMRLVQVRYEYGFVY